MTDLGTEDEMSTIIKIPEFVYDQLMNHLLPDDLKDEEVAFIFVSVIKEHQSLTLKYNDWFPVNSADFESRSPFHFELKEQTTASIIKRAHELDCAIVEFHSHVKQISAQFSPTDFNGFKEFVPHVLWRLKDKPYFAVVVTHTSFDALVWLDSLDNPTELKSIQLENHDLKPTNKSIYELKQNYNDFRYI